jgi:hypothetical protein
MKYLFGLFSLLLFSAQCLAQIDSSGMVKYTPDFKFIEGVYLNFDQVRTNSPLPKSRIISTYDYNDPDFFEKLFEKDVISYYDNLGNRSELKAKNVWGYSRNGFIYVKMADGFFRITLIGSICHFIATETTTNYYNSPYPYNYYMDPYRMGPTTNSTTEMHQYLLDFDTGRVLDYTEESLEVLLMQDPVLHDEYVSLSKKKRKQMKFMYIRKYNEKHPLYFPKN